MQLKTHVPSARAPARSGSFRAGARRPVAVQPLRAKSRGSGAPPADDSPPEPAAPPPAPAAAPVVPPPTPEQQLADARASLDAAQQLAAGAVSEAVDVVEAEAREAADSLREATAGAASAAGEAAAAVQRLAVEAVTDPGPEVKPAGSDPDDRFAGLTVVVAGATGGVGRRVVEVLREKGVPVRALVRDELRAAKLLPPAKPGQLEVTEADVFQFASLPAAFGDANALVICTGAKDFRDPLGPFNTDFQGTSNLVALAKQRGFKHVVLVTSIGTDDLLNPLNAFWGVLFWKKRAEEELQRSGLPYTIVRPGGLKNRLRSGEVAGNVVMARPGYYGFPPLQRSGSILRSQVAEVCVEALVVPAAKDKVVEIIAEPDYAKRTIPELFDSVRM